MGLARESFFASVGFAAAVLIWGSGGCSGSQNDGRSGFQSNTNSSSSGSTIGDGSDDGVAPVDYGDATTLVDLDGSTMGERAAPPQSCVLPGLWCYQTGPKAPYPAANTCITT